MVSAFSRRWGSTRRLLIAFALVAGALASVPLSGLPAAEGADEEAVYSIVFPIAGETSYRDTWGAPRSGGRTHKGTDIFAAKRTPVVAAADGRVVVVGTGERAGRFIIVEHEGGWRTYYLHLDNDTEGTDDGLGGAPAEGIAAGVTVKAGQVLDYVGDSGNAEETPSHLHFEIHHASGEATNPYPHLRAAEGRPVANGVQAARAAVTPAFSGENVSYVGRFDPGGGFATDIAVHNEVAYLGTWGRPGTCPGSGVRLIDVSDPALPAAMGAIATGEEFPGTGTDSVWVGSVDTRSFTGDLAVVAIRLCDTGERNRRGDTFRGMALYDVSDPTVPILLGTYDSGVRTQGIHEIDVVARDDGSLLAAATALQSVRHTAGAAGDLRIVAISDPTAPREIADWDLRRDGPTELVDSMLGEVYDDLELHTHSATWTEDGTGLWVANWDAGVTLLDTTNPMTPSVVSIFGYDPSTEGNAHSVALDSEAGILIRSDQDLINADVERHSPGWGGQRIYDVADPEAITEIGSFTSERSVSREDGSAIHVDGRYSAHSAQIVNHVEYVAWYSDGLRIVDFTDPTAPVEIGSFIPPARVDPQGYWEAPDGTQALAMVWGVDVEGDLIYVSDMHSGLWIVEYAPPQPPGEELPAIEMFDGV